MTSTNGIQMINLLKNPHTIGYILAIAIIGYLLINRPVEYVPIEYEEDTSMRDTVYVEKTRVDTLIKRDTTFIELDISDPEQEGELQVYTTNYVDSTLSATITSRVNGTLVSQDLWYVSKIDYIINTKWRTMTVNRYLKPTRVFEDPNRNNPKGLWGGITAEQLSNDISFTPSLILFRGNIGYEVGYNISSESLNTFDASALRVGVKFKLF